MTAVRSSHVMSHDRFDLVNFGSLYRSHWVRAGGRAKPAGRWDARAAAMRGDVFSGRYVDALVARLDLRGCTTLLDVGCGPGTVALTVAPQLERVYGLDNSPGMLAAFVALAQQIGVACATPILRGWEDDWTGVPVCDIVVASRSSHVADLEAALGKLNAHATRRAYLTHLVGGRFLDPAICDALGRDDAPLPDYIYAVNILHQWGIHPRLDYIDGESRFRHCTNADDFVRKVSSSVDDLTARERNRLCALYEEQGERLGTTPMRWALISWEIPGSTRTSV